MVQANADNLKSLAGRQITASIDGLTLKAQVADAPAPPAPAAAPASAPKKNQSTQDNSGTGDGTAAPTTVDPIDLNPLPHPSLEWNSSILKPSDRGDGVPYTRGDGVRYIFVYEDLSVDPRSDAFATETDRVVIRFIARDALLCRYYAASDDKNEYKPSIGRVGGTDALKSLVPNFTKDGAQLNDPANAGKPVATSCGYDLYQGLEKGHFRLAGTGGPDGTGGNTYGYVDFTFGPFTSDQLAFHLFRHDRQFKGNDMEGQVKVANHLRYVGWADLVAVGTTLAKPNQVISVNRQNGSELTRIAVSNERQQIDLAAQIKFFVTCTGPGNYPGKPQDLSVAAACFGVSSGFSLTHPTRRFYPLGINLTLGRYLSLNVLSLMERSTRLSAGYNSGDLFSGAASDVPTHDRIVFGAGIGIGVDPTLVGDLVGQIVKAGF